jgi:enoyl-CoA hydratase/carnithine racemase
MDLMLTGRWVEAAEALRIGLVSRIDDDPEQAAESLAGALAQQSAAVPAVKSVALAGGLLDRLDAERTANRQAWARVLARPASGELRQGT